MRVDKKGFVKPRKNIEKVLTKNFVKKRYENVRKEMKKDRDKYETQMLLKPLQRYLKETEEKESNRSLEGSS